MEDKQLPQMEAIVERIIAAHTDEWGIKVGAIARAVYRAGFDEGYLEAVDDDALTLSPRRLKS